MACQREVLLDPRQRTEELVCLQLRHSRQRNSQALPICVGHQMVDAIAYGEARAMVGLRELRVQGSTMLVPEAPDAVLYVNALTVRDSLLL